MQSGSVIIKIKNQNSKFFLETMEATLRTRRERDRWQVISAQCTGAELACL